MIWLSLPSQLIANRLVFLTLGFDLISNMEDYLTSKFTLDQIWKEPLRI